MQDLNITLVQPELTWLDKNTNLNQIAQLVEPVAQTDIIVLPEMFNTGFTMQAERFAETMDGASIQFMQNMARQKQAVVLGSLIITENNHFFNRLLWVDSEGIKHTYDKRHLFRMAGEHEHYTPGKNLLVVDYKGWKICPMICYDLRFPVWSRVASKADVLIYVANWPNIRQHAWKTLLMARAMENQVYVIGVNAVGKDTNEIYHSGDTACIDPKGNPLIFLDEGKAATTTLKLNYQKLQDWREQFPAWKDKDDFEIKL